MSDFTKEPLLKKYIARTDDDRISKNGFITILARSQAEAEKGMYFYVERKLRNEKL